MGASYMGLTTMQTMLATILSLMLTSRGTPASAVPGEDLVIITGRPGCYGQALYGDPTRPVIRCDRPSK